MDRLRHARMVRTAAEAVISTIQLSQCYVVPSAICSFVLDDMADNDADEGERSDSSNTEAKVLFWLMQILFLVEIRTRVKFRFFSKTLKYFKLYQYNIVRQ